MNKQLNDRDKLAQSNDQSSEQKGLKEESSPPKQRASKSAPTTPEKKSSKEPAASSGKKTSKGALEPSLEQLSASAKSESKSASPKARKSGKASTKQGTEAVEPEQKPPRTSSSNSWAWLRWLLLLALLGACGYYGFKYTQDYYRQQQASLSSLQQQLLKQQQQVGDRLASIEGRWDSLRQQQNSLAFRFENQQAKLRQRVDKALSNNDYQWLFAEVQYWLQLAQQHSKLDTDSTHIIRLLEAAKQQLQVLDWKEARVIIEAIDKDIALLQASQKLDYRTFYAQLVAIQQQLAKAPFIGFDSDSPDDEEATAEVEVAGWLGNIRGKLDFLNDIFIIEYSPNSESKTVPFKLEDRHLLRQQIDLQFEQIKLAILQQDWALAPSQLQRLNDQVSPLLQAPDQLQRLSQLLELIGQLPAPPTNIQSLATLQQQMALLDIQLGTTHD